MTQPLEERWELGQCPGCGALAPDDDYESADHTEACRWEEALTLVWVVPERLLVEEREARKWLETALREMADLARLEDESLVDYLWVEEHVRAALGSPEEKEG